MALSNYRLRLPIVDNRDLAAARRTCHQRYLYYGQQTVIAITILGWPVADFPEIAREVTEGGRYACHQARITSAGDTPSITPGDFGLAVTRIIPTEQVKNNAQAGSGYFWPLGQISYRQKNHC